MKKNPYAVLNWFFSPTKKENNYPSIYDKISELEDRIAVLEEENIGMTNALYELENSLDARIDILAEYCRNTNDV
jgi:hypothetical protein